MALFSECTRKCASKKNLTLPTLSGMQLRVLSFCGGEDGNVGIGVFPERQEILIRGFEESAYLIAARR